MSENDMRIRRLRNAFCVLAPLLISGTLFGFMALVGVFG
jgi:hypothetical protein